MCLLQTGKVAPPFPFQIVVKVVTRGGIFMQKLSPHFFPGHLPRMVVGALLVAISLAGAMHFSAVHAAGGVASFSLKPTSFDPSVPATSSYFILSAHAGTILKRSVLVTNSGTATGTTTLSAVDATTGQTSGTVFLASNVKQRNAGTWISLSAQHVTLAPKQSKMVSFQVVVPRNALAGQHIGGIVAADEVKAPKNKKHSVQITIQNLSIIAVQINLPGPVIEQLSTSGIQAGGANGYQSLLVKLNNAGNDMLKPEGSLKVFDAQGHLLQTASMKLDTFLPGTSINYPVNVQKKVLRPGKYQATLKLNYGKGRVLNYTTNFTITQQQVAQVFQATSTPLQTPGSDSNISSTMPLWLIALIGLTLLSGAFFWTQKFYVMAAASRQKSKSEAEAVNRVPQMGKKMR
jgi:hypothetical protein